jgi:HEPN domain-containing protein
VKAFLVLNTGEVPWGHSVSDLCQVAVQYDERFGPLQKVGAGLDLFYIPMRYPNGLPGGLPAEAFDGTDSERALARAGRIIDAAEAGFSQ